MVLSATHGTARAISEFIDSDHCSIVFRKGEVGWKQKNTLKNYLHSYAHQRTRSDATRKCSGYEEK